MKKWIAALVVLTATATASACPMCKDSVPNDQGANTLRDSYTSNGENISGGMNASVYLMLGGLFAVVGMVSRVVIKGMGSARK